MDSCHQYLKRIENYQKDLDLLKGLAVPDRIDCFNFSLLQDSPFSFSEIRNFIVEHEWLENVPKRVSHVYVASYKNILAGAVLFTSPHQPGNICGEEHNDLERLLARGACISWSPKNLASALIGYAFRSLKRTTQYRIITAYCDSEAGEIGTIYQACNGLYIGNNFGTANMYHDMNDLTSGWKSPRQFTNLHTTQKLAKLWGIEWQPEWNTRTTINWDKIPKNTVDSLKVALKLYREDYLGSRRELKYKYVWLLDKKLRGQMKYKIKPYPKRR